jgi:hypothetical protein
MMITSRQLIRLIRCAWPDREMSLVGVVAVVRSTAEYSVSVLHTRSLVVYETTLPAVNRSWW